MGEPDHVDVSDLSDADRAEVIDLVARLRARRGAEPAPTSDDDEWLVAGLKDAANGLAAIEADLPPEQLASWLRALDAGATPITWDDERGEFVVVAG